MYSLSFLMVKIKTKEKDRRIHCIQVYTLSVVPESYPYEAMTVNSRVSPLVASLRRRSPEVRPVRVFLPERFTPYEGLLLRRYDKVWMAFRSLSPYNHSPVFNLLFLTILDIKRQIFHSSILSLFSCDFHFFLSA